MKKPFTQERPIPLLVNRREIAAGVALLLGTAPVSARALSELNNVKLGFEPDTFMGQMRDGLFLPDYRVPMVRLVHEDGYCTKWIRYALRNMEMHRAPNCGRVYSKAVAVEVCCPDRNGMPRYTSLNIG